MLLIRDAQMDRLSEVAEERFVERVRVFLRSSWPDACAALGDDGVRASVRRGMTQAARFGIATERDIVRYVNVMYLLGPDFCEEPDRDWARRILDAPGRSGAAKLDELYALIEQQLEIGADA